VNNLHIITLYKLHNKLSCEAHRARVQCVEPCYSTSLTQPKCIQHVERGKSCRVEMWWANWNLGLCVWSVAVELDAKRGRCRICSSWTESQWRL